MLMTPIGIRNILFIATAMALSACGDKNPSNISVNATENIAEPSPPSPPPAPPPPPPPSAPPPCEAKAPDICSGPMILGLKDVALQWSGKPRGNGNRPVQGTATLTIENRTANPVQIALLRSAITLKFKGGITLTMNGSNSGNISGLQACGFDGTACMNQGREKFTAITPGDSPIRVTMTFKDILDSAQIPALAQADEAEISLSVWAISSDSPSGEQRTFSIGGAPVVNSTVE